MTMFLEAYGGGAGVFGPCITKAKAVSGFSALAELTPSGCLNLSGLPRCLQFCFWCPRTNHHEDHEQIMWFC